MHNPFPKEQRYLFEDSWTCWWCGKNTATAQHHIVGRGAGDSKVESSIFNCAWLCNYTCHINIHGLIRTDENVILLLNKTRSFLIGQRYIPKEIDAEFMKKYKKYY